MLKPSLVVLSFAVLTACGVGIASDPPLLQVKEPLTLSSPVVEDDTLVASVAYENPGNAVFTVQDLSIEVVAPDGAKTDNPVELLTPAIGTTTVKPGEVLQLTASRMFTPQDAEGTWQAYSVFRALTGQRFHGPRVMRWRRGLERWRARPGRPEGAL